MKQLIFEEDLVIKFLEDDGCIGSLIEVGRIANTESYLWRSNLPYTKMRFVFKFRGGSAGSSIVKRVEAMDTHLLIVPEAVRRFLKRAARGTILLEIEKGWRKAKAKAKGEAKNGKKGTREGV